MNTIRACFLTLLVLVAIGGNSVNGAVLARWSAQNTFTATYPTVAPLLDPSVSASLTLENYQGLTPFNDGRNVWRGMNTTGTIDTDQYISFTLTMHAGYLADLTSFQFGLAVNPVGSASAIVRSSLDGFGSNLGTFTPTTAYQTFTVDMSSFAPLSTITVRIYGINSSSATAGWFNTNGGLSGVFNGDVVAVPEPSTWALFTVATGLIAVMTIRKKRFSDFSQMPSSQD